MHPRLLTTALVEAAVAKGARLVKARVSGLRLAEDGGALTGEMLPRQDDRVEPWLQQQQTLTAETAE